METLPISDKKVIPSTVRNFQYSNWHSTIYYAHSFSEINCRIEKKILRAQRECGCTSWFMSWKNMISPPALPTCVGLKSICFKEKYQTTGPEEKQCDRKCASVRLLPNFFILKKTESHFFKFLMTFFGYSRL